eukprot:3458953-Amphidinium_carterae.1
MLSVTQLVYEKFGGLGRLLKPLLRKTPDDGLPVCPPRSCHPLFIHCVRPSLLRVGPRLGFLLHGLSMLWVGVLSRTHSNEPR